MRKLVCMLLLLAAAAGAETLPVRIRCVPPNPTVTLIGPEDSRLDVSGGIAPGRWKGRVVLELSSPGYQPRRIEIQATPVKSVELPVESDEFYRLEPIIARIAFESRPANATVWLVKGGHREHLGPAGQPLELDLSVVAPASEGRFELTLPGYRSETVVVRLSELEKLTRVGPLELRPSFPGAPLVSWLALRPALCWVLLGLLLVGMVAVGTRLRGRRSRC